MKRFISFFSALLLLPFSLMATNVELWYALDGPLKEAFEEIIAEYNASQTEDKIVLTKWNDYRTIYLEGVKSTKEGKGPHLLHVYEAATASMIEERDVYIPVEEVLGNGSSLEQFFDPIRAFYSTSSGKMLALPWNSSCGVLFYNQEAFIKAGLDSANPPTTWEEMELAFEALAKAGYKGMTSAWQAAYHLEHVCSLHNIPFASGENGFSDPHPQLLFNTPEIQFHWSKLVEWQDKGWFIYGTNNHDYAENLFCSGECAFIMQGANRYPLLKKKAGFTICATPLPYWKKITPQPYNLNIGGAAFWLMQGKPKEDLEATKKVLQYLSSTPVQLKWHMQTSYLPATKATYALAEKAGFYESNPAAKAAILQVMRSPLTPYTHGIRIDNYIPIRNKIVTCLEKALSKECSVEDALKEAASQP